ncbi:helix-turn-helix domain-containing protein [Accumulibacter sp.]|uniref:helix-turn-helix domain-containing protein n=1 Tax=Accumulibacter sp. TaxID=2053492 RepID=UPI002C6FB744|nr:helix-turn-helix domain-containing protein [Accumulibacter sp.]HNC21241.1 helix-turn-helix domain-containing protein [Accumulibacter sp.]
MSESSRFSAPAAPGLPAADPFREQLTSGETLAPVSGSVGQQLRTAREARNMSLAEVAQSLKLGPRQIAAIEAEDWASLPGNTMIRGFVRNYARLLNVDADTLMHGLDAAQLQQTAQLEVSAGTTASLPNPSNRRPQRRDYLAVLAGLLLLGLAVLAYFYVPADFWQEKLAALLARNPVPVQQPAAPPVAPSPAATGESVTIVPTPNATVLSDTATNGRGLRLRFMQPAWVEVRDGRGQIVFAELSPAGSQREVTGQPPFSLVVGNATQVTIEYQGRMIDISQRIKGDVARLTIE